MITTITFTLGPHFYQTYFKRKSPVKEKERIFTYFFSALEKRNSRSVKLPKLSETNLYHPSLKCWKGTPKAFHGFVVVMDGHLIYENVDIEKMDLSLANPLTSDI